MKIILPPIDYINYHSEVVAVVDFVKSIPQDENGIVNAISMYNSALVKLSGFQQDANSDMMDKMYNDASFKSRKLNTIKAELREVKDAIAERLSQLLDPAKQDSVANPGLETIKLVTRWYISGMAFDFRTVGNTDMAEVCRVALIRRSRQWSFDLKPSIFTCCSALGIKAPFAQVVKDLYSMELSELIPESFPGLSHESTIDARASLMGALRIEGSANNESITD
nr:25 kDa protein [wheat closterovirus 1]